MATLETAFTVVRAFREPAWYGVYCADEDRAEILTYGYEPDGSDYGADEALQFLRGCFHYEPSLEPDNERAWIADFKSAYAKRAEVLYEQE